MSRAPTVEAPVPTEAIVDLARELVRAGAITTGPRVHEDGVARAFGILRRFADEAGLNAIAFEEDGRFPALYCDAGAPGSAPRAEMLLVGHYDVVLPERPDQLEAVVDGDWLRGRGAADMLTVVASALAFLAERAALRRGGRPAPRIGFLVVGNEEIAETEPWGTPHVLAALRARFGYAPRLLVAGERTGEGASPAGLVEPRNRGICRIHVEAEGASAHTGMLRRRPPVARLVELARRLEAAFADGRAEGAWRTTFGVSYLLGGQEGNFNIAPRRAVAGFEIRPAWPGDIPRARRILDAAAADLDVRVNWLNAEGPVAADPADPRVAAVVEAAARAAGRTPAAMLGRGKLAGSSARFAPEGCAALVWGQSGVGPHSAHEAHYLPSIAPWFRALRLLAEGAFAG